jgi:hypothetical protein
VGGPKKKKENGRGFSRKGWLAAGGWRGKMPGSRLETLGFEGGLRWAARWPVGPCLGLVGGRFLSPLFRKTVFFYLFFLFVYKTISNSFYKNKISR